MRQPWRTVTGIACAMALILGGAQVAAAEEPHSAQATSPESMQEAADAGALMLVDGKDVERGVERVDGYFANGLRFDLAEGDALTVAEDGQSVELEDSAGDIVFSFSQPTLTSEDGSQTLEARFLYQDEVLFLAPASATGEIQLNEHCFASWFGGFVTTVAGELLVCLPVSLINPFAGIVCGISMAALTNLLDYDISC